MKFLAAAPSNHDTFPEVAATIAQCTPKSRGIGRTKRWVAGHALGMGLILQHWWECVAAKADAEQESPEPRQPSNLPGTDDRGGESCSN